MASCSLPGASLPWPTHCSFSPPMYTQPPTLPPSASPAVHHCPPLLRLAPTPVHSRVLGV
ncbi:hypothetical protein E2C01_006789 [Portunus trituberculatus]|uniref:Uncharacterized protein n=1 Tax=Portunus trituberculatus TaxID=210409 RepID=A0A5B7D0M1_PORTR|nr:hypothetical protein [Portunus trituberculatus]